jgi:hypothetical protein
MSYTEFGGKWSCCNGCTFPEYAWRTEEKHSQDGQNFDRDSKPASPEYKPRELPLRKPARCTKYCNYVQCLQQENKGMSLVLIR